MDRLDYVSMMCNEHAYVRAIENLIGIEAPEPRAVDPHDVRRDHAHPQSPDVGRLERARSRRDGGVPLRVPRARRADGLLRSGVAARACTRRITARAASIAICPSRCRKYHESRWHKGDDLKRINAWREGSMLDYLEQFTDDFPQRVDEYEDTADRQPHLEAAHGRHRRRLAGAGAGVGHDRPDAARLGHRVGSAQEAAVREVRRRSISTSRSASTATATTAISCASRRCASRTASSSSA